MCRLSADFGVESSASNGPSDRYSQPRVTRVFSAIHLMETRRPEFFLLQREVMEFVHRYLTNDDPARVEERAVAALVLASTSGLANALGPPLVS